MRGSCFAPWKAAPPGAWLWPALRDAAFFSQIACHWQKNSLLIAADAEKLLLLGHPSGLPAPPPVLVAGSDECGKERVRLQRSGLKLGVKLTAQEPGMIGQFTNFDVRLVGCFPGYPQAARRQGFLILEIGRAHV